MEAFETFLETYGVAAACLIMLVKASGVPIPIPGDVILLATAARAAEGKVVLWLAFTALLAAILAGSLLQFLLARGPARRLIAHYGSRIGLTNDRIERVGARMRQTGPLGIGLGVLTPGVRSAVIPACGLTGMPLAAFLPGLAIGCAVDLALHFGIGYAGSGLLAMLVAPSPLLVVVALAALGLAAWLLLARRRGARAADAIAAWNQATCPVCLAVGAIVPRDAEPAVRWEGAA
jgi:membrane protein DedA with SNARE-associated domain